MGGRTRSSPYRTHLIPKLLLKQNGNAVSECRYDVQYSQLFFSNGRFDGNYPSCVAPYSQDSFKKVLDDTNEKWDFHSKRGTKISLLFILFCWCPFFLLVPICFVGFGLSGFTMTLTMGSSFSIIGIVICFVGFGFGGFMCVICCIVNALIQSRQFHFRVGIIEDYFKKEVNPNLTQYNLEWEIQVDRIVTYRGVPINQPQSSVNSNFAMQNQINQQQQIIQQQQRMLEQQQVGMIQQQLNNQPTNYNQPINNNQQPLNYQLVQQQLYHPPPVQGYTNNNKDPNVPY